MERYIRTSLVALVLLLLQTTFVPFLSFEGYGPDLLLIWVVYIAIQRGQLEAAIAGFLVGFLQDVSTTQFFGLAALAKTVSGFAAGYFFNENKTAQTLGTYRFALIIFLSSLIHNILYYTIFFQGTEASLVAATLQVSFVTGVYTSILGFLPMFVFARRHSVT